MAAIALLPADAAAGNDQCGKRKDITQQLQQKCKERLVGLGITSQGGLVEVLAARDGATSSIIVTTSEGVTCLVAAGEGWRSGGQTTDQRPRLSGALPCGGQAMCRAGRRTAWRRDQQT
jgi:hypothetical protein